MYDVAIMGSGPAGLTAALYSARANLSTVVITGDDFGGQIATTNDVENYPGFEAITGPDLSMRMRQQAEKFGAEFEIELITDIEVEGPPFKLIGRSGEYQALSVILANGASPKTLGIPGEQELWGRGVSFCATCDGAFFRDVPIAVVGGGDSAIQEALFLTRFGSKVIVIHRRDELRAGATLRDRAFANDKIEFLWDTVVTEIKGEAEVEALRVRNVKSGDESDISIGGVFVYVGHYPNTELLKGKVALDEDGYVVSDRRMHTSVPGVFVAGEAQDHYFRQAVTAAGEGCQAALEAEKYVALLESMQPAREPAEAAAST